MGDVENGQGSATEQASAFRTAELLSTCRHVARAVYGSLSIQSNMLPTPFQLPNDDLLANFTTYVLAFDHDDFLGSVSDHSSGNVDSAMTELTRFAQSRHGMQFASQPSTI